MYTQQSVGEEDHRHGRCRRAGHNRRNGTGTSVIFLQRKVTLYKDKNLTFFFSFCVCVCADSAVDSEPGLNNGEV